MIDIAQAYTLIKTFGYMVIRKVPYYPLIVSFDVTNRCTLKCQHCYWREQKQEGELTEEEFLNKIREIKKAHPTLLGAVWLGGEPLLRKNLVETGKKSFLFNEVITNGTLPLSDWHDVRFAVSVDGTKKFHELTRGKNIYEKIKENINRKDLNVNIICIITKINQECLEEMVVEWSKTNIRTIGFGFYTPILGKDNEKIWLDFKARDLVIERILKLKKKFPSFINTSETMLNNFRSDKCQEITEKCRRDYAPYISMCFDSMLKRKFPCVIGENAMCEKCGCGGAILTENIKSGDWSFLKEHLKNRIPFFGRNKKEN